jgi:hypothetical protein
MRLPGDFDPAPRILLDRNARAVNSWVVVREMTRKPQRELLDLSDCRLLGERVHRVLLRVRRHDVAVVAREVARGKVTRQRDADVDVLDLVHRTVGAALRHAHQMGLRLPVLVVSEADRHRLTSLCMWRSRMGSAGAAHGGAPRGPRR